MDSLTSRLRKVNESKTVFKKIFHNKSNYYLIHYSCESFIENGGHSLKVTSIAIRRLDNAQTESFSVFQYAEKMGIHFSEIQTRYDEIEKKMLNEYFRFIDKFSGSKYIHWNMRDINYGFKAIEHRGDVLGCKTFKLSDENKIDLSRLLIERYSKNYIQHPRLESLLDLNCISKQQFLTGKQEAEAFVAGEYLKLHQSTLRKVDTFENILDRIGDNDLKVESNFREIHGLTLASVTKMIKEHWIMSLVTILSAVIGITFKIIDILGLNTP